MYTLGDSNPRPHRGSELESDALTNSAKGAFLPVVMSTCARIEHTQSARGGGLSPQVENSVRSLPSVEWGYSSVVEQSVAAR